MLPAWWQSLWFRVSAAAGLLGFLGLAHRIRTRRIEERNRLLQREIAERKEAQSALEQSENQLRLMADSLPALISYVDSSQRYQFNNLAFERWFGIPRDRAAGRPVREVLGEEAFAAIRGGVETVLSGKTASEDIVLHNGTTPRRVHAWFVPHLDRDGNVLGFYALMNDATEQVEAEEQARRIRDDLAHVSRVTTLGELAASLAHELNQPLSAIVSNAEAGQVFLAAEAPDIVEVREILGDVADDGRRAGEVIRRLRTLLKKKEVEREPIDINEVIREVIALLRNDAMLENIVLETELASHLPPTKGDRVQIQQVILNLMRNGSEAIQASPDEPRRLRISTGRESPAAIIVSARDSGPPNQGMDLERMFTPFYTTKADGLGMGLAISRSIVHAHGGRIWAEVNPGGGLQVKFTLPSDGE